MPKLNLKLALILGAFMAVILASTAFAQRDEDDGAKNVDRRYPGGQDEQPLTVQSSLPLSTRSADAARPTPASSAEEASETHD